MRWLLALTPFLFAACGGSVDAEPEERQCPVPAVYTAHWTKVEGTCPDFPDEQVDLSEASYSEKNCDLGGDVMRPNRAATFICSGWKCDVFVSRDDCSGKYSVELAR